MVEEDSDEDVDVLSRNTRQNKRYNTFATRENSPHFGTGLASN